MLRDCRNRVVSGMLNRRRFIQSIAAAAAAPALTQSCGAAVVLRRELRTDPNAILDLPEGFGYRIVSRVGDAMSDGLRVPGAHDGMKIYVMRLNVAVII